MAFGGFDLHIAAMAIVFGVLSTVAAAFCLGLVARRRTAGQGGRYLPVLTWSLGLAPPWQIDAAGPPLLIGGSSFA